MNARSVGGFATSSMTIVCYIVSTHKILTLNNKRSKEDVVRDQGWQMYICMQNTKYTLTYFVCCTDILLVSVHRRLTMGV